MGPNKGTPRGVAFELFMKKYADFTINHKKIPIFQKTAEKKIVLLKNAKKMNFFKNGKNRLTAVGSELLPLKVKSADLPLRYTDI